MRTLLMASTLAFVAAPVMAQLDEEVDLGHPVRIRVVMEDGATLLRVSGRGRDVERALPSASATGATVSVIGLAGGAKLALVRLAERAEALVVARNGRPEILWVGRTSLHGDLGEQRRDVVQVADRTGDGVDDVIVGTTQRGRAICGEESTLLDPRAVDPGAMALRSVSLRNLGEGTELEVRPTTEPPEGLQRPEAPLIALLQPRGASSAAGRSDPPLPVGLVDGDPTTAWVEAAPGGGRWQFATLRVTDPGLPIRALRLVPRPGADGGVPAELYLQGDSGSRLRVPFPREPAAGEVWWVTLPEPATWSCLSVVLGAPFGDPPHVGLAELTAFSAIDFGGGLTALVRRLAAGGEEGARAARALRSLGPGVLETLASGWTEMTGVERRLVLQVAAAHPGEAHAAGLFVAAASDDDEAVRDGASVLAEGADEPALLVALASAEGPTASPVADRAALVLARRFPTEVGTVLEAIQREGGEDRPVLRRALRTAVVRGESPVREEVSAWLAGARPGALAAVSLALAGTDGAEDLVSVALASAPASTEFADRWRHLAAVEGGATPDAEVALWIAGLARDAEEWMLRAAAIRALAAAAVPDATRVAREGLSDAYPRVRIAAVDALVGHEGSLEQLVGIARRDPWPMVRASAVQSLGPVGGARPLVRAAVRDRHESVRAAAIRALAAAGDWSAWASVEDRLVQPREWPAVLDAGVAYARARCQEDAVDALGEVIDRAQRPNPWQPDVEVAAKAVEALAAIGGEEARERIRRADSDLSPSMIRIAAQAAERVQSCR